jgi:hypothetical protein
MDQKMPAAADTHQITDARRWKSSSQTSARIVMSTIDVNADLSISVLPSTRIP